MRSLGLISLSLAVTLAGCSRTPEPPPPSSTDPNQVVTQALADAASAPPGSSFVLQNDRSFTTSGLNGEQINVNVNDDRYEATGRGRKVVISKTRATVDDQGADVPKEAKKFEIKYEGDQVTILADGKEVMKSGPKPK